MYRNKKMQNAKYKKAKTRKHIKSIIIAKALGCQLLVQKCIREQNIKREKTQKIAEKPLAPSIFHRIFR